MKKRRRFKAVDDKDIIKEFFDDESEGVQKPEEISTTPKPFEKINKPTAKPQKQPFDTKILSKIKSEKIKFSARLDLHGYSESAAFGALSYFIDNNFEKNRRNLLVITGKGSKSGSGIIKRAVALWLERPEFSSKVAFWREAASHHGGSGALYIYLKKN